MNGRVSPLWGALGGLLVAGFLLLGGDGCGGRSVGVVCRFLSEALGIPGLVRASPVVGTLGLVAVGAALGWVGGRMRP
ncbi:hypothetical protein [Halosegnis marinus]|uniref:YeeE/YedE family protein n=1 Tax=Halosegnis marinus TaxID=3034023 RepID=A0ABD5ZN61_9EURY|nr:hypothetical protein [Halosegnis sp. DT85]